MRSQVHHYGYGDRLSIQTDKTFEFSNLTPGIFSALVYLVKKSKLASTLTKILFE